MRDGRITVRALIVGTVFAALFAFMSVYFENRHRIYVTTTQIPVLPYVLLFASVLLINPLCRLVRFVRTFTVTEIMLIFIMGMVSAGISTFGMASFLVPMIGNLSNSHWNNGNSRWDLYVEPHVNDAYFICEPGTTEAAKKLLDVDTSWRSARRILRTAKRLKLRQDELATASEKLAAAATIADGEGRRRAQALYRHARSLAKKSLKSARERWAEYAEQHNVPDVLATYPERIEALEKTVALRRTELDAIKAAAFEKVSVFRRGLPERMRAVPGLVYEPGEGLDAYAGRVGRLTHGTSALADLREADRALGEAIRSGGDAGAEAAEHIGKAVKKLEPVSRPEKLREARRKIEAKVQAERQRVYEEERALRGLHRVRRRVHAEEAGALEDEIESAKLTITQLKKRVTKLEGERDLFTASRLATVELVRDTRLALSALQAGLQSGVHAPYPVLQEQLWDQMDQFRSFDASLPRFVVGDVPWSHWIGPLLRWAFVIGLSYLVLMALNVLIFRQWAHNERLIYPLAKFPELLAGADAPESGRGIIPSLFRSGLFWVGFAVSAGVMGYNVFCQTKLVPGLKSIPLVIMWQPYIQGSIFGGLDWAPRFHIFFVMIGFSFMIPARISFSLWFFWLLGMLQVLFLVWSGYGQSIWSFPNDDWWVFNFQTAEGAGALMVFSAVVLFKCRKYILSFLMPRAVDDLELAERIELRVSSFLFIFGSIGLILVLTCGFGANLFYTIFFYFAVLAVSIGLTRAVAEGGILGFQAWASPFHLIRTLFGMNKVWAAPPLYAPLLVYHFVLFHDLRGFIVPSMATSLKIGNDMKMRRLRFHLSMTLAIVAAAVVAVITYIVIAYDKGQAAMNQDLAHMPQGAFGRFAAMVRDTPVDTTACFWWLFFGAGVMAALLFLRRFVFWLPHPIGLIMFVNPVSMRSFWFSLMLGWGAKSLVSKYGNKDVYIRLRAFFVGLIVGELLLVVVAMLLSYAGLQVHLDLNRG